MTNSFLNNVIMDKLHCFLLLVFGLVSCNSQRETNSENMPTVQVVGDETEQAFVEGDALHQWEANEKLTKLRESFGSEQAMQNHERPKYPEYYGGGYITELGGLVVNIHGDLEKGKKAVVSVIGEDNIEFKKVAYSYAYLTSLMDEFYDFAIERKDPELMGMIAAFALMDMTNEVMVNVVGLDERKLEILKKSVFNKPGVRFERSEGHVVLE